MSDKLSERDHIVGLLEVMYEFAGDGEGIIDFLRHIGFDLLAIRRPRDLIEALPAFYRIRAGRYDVQRMERDLMSWGPISSAVEQVRRQSENEQDEEL